MSFGYQTTQTKGNTGMEWKKIKLIGGIVGIVFVLVAVVSFAREIFETNNAGFYQVKQAAFTGTTTIVNTPGTYFRLFGNITTYQNSDMHYFSKSNLDGGKGTESDPVPVRFKDGGTADISGGIKFRLPTNPEKQLVLHRDFKTYENVKHDLVRQTVAEALIQTASIMRAEEMYTTRRGEFTALAEEQIKNGIYETTINDLNVSDNDGGEVKERIVQIKLDANGRPVIRKESPFKTYGVEVVQFSIKEIDFDKTIDTLIAKKKETEQQKVVAIAAAEKAKQDAITAREQGNARIAEERATQEVAKIKEVTIAQKEYEVAKLRRQQAEQDAASEVTKGKALAEVNRLKVQAGLTPLERAQIGKEVAIGVAGELAKVRFPEMMVLGGSGGKTAADPWEAVGLESMMRISKKLSSEHLDKTGKEE